MRQYSQAEVNSIQDRACERITEILDALGMEYVERRDYIHAACPVHGGDNERAWYWAYNSKHWKCMTQHCQDTEASGKSTSIFGLVRGAMTRKTGKKWDFIHALKFVAQVLRLNKQDIDPETEEEMEVDRAIREYRKKLKSVDRSKGLLLAEMLPQLTPDTVYYPSRGIPSEIIARYHVSFCDDPTKPFYRRAFFPILDETGRYVMGWSGRSTWPQCNHCKHYHDPQVQCPPKSQYGIYEKWRHSAGFRAERHLYNIWYARPHIAKTGTAILVEGPGDTWSFERAGVNNSVGMFGLHVSTFQRQMLQRAGALSLVIACDNDKSGLESRERLLKELNWYFRVYFVTPEGTKDVGEMNADQIDAQYKPLLDHISRAKVMRAAVPALEGAKV